MSSQGSEEGNLRRSDMRCHICGKVFSYRMDNALHLYQTHGVEPPEQLKNDKPFWDQTPKYDAWTADKDVPWGGTDFPSGDKDPTPAEAAEQAKKPEPRSAMKRDPGQEDATDPTTVQVRQSRAVRFREDTKNVPWQDFDPGKYSGRDEFGSSADEVSESSKDNSTSISSDSFVLNSATVPPARPAPKPKINLRAVIEAAAPPPQPKPPGPPNNIPTCLACYATFNTDRELREHRKVNKHNIRRRKHLYCSICGEEFEEYAVWKQHIYDTNHWDPRTQLGQEFNDRRLRREARSASRQTVNVGRDLPPVEDETEDTEVAAAPPPDEEEDLIDLYSDSEKDKGKDKEKEKEKLNAAAPVFEPSKQPQQPQQQEQPQQSAWW